MNATYPTQRTHFPLSLFLLSLIALTILAITFAPPKVWGALGLTKHAQSTHAQDQWNPASIQAHFSAGKCTPYTYSCRDGKREISWCNQPGRPGQAIGLVINKITQSIITGFSATQDYWRNACP